MVLSGGTRRSPQRPSLGTRFGMPSGGFLLRLTDCFGFSAFAFVALGVGDGAVAGKEDFRFGRLPIANDATGAVREQFDTSVAVSTGVVLDISPVPSPVGRNIAPDDADIGACGLQNVAHGVAASDTHRSPLHQREKTGCWRFCAICDDCHSRSTTLQLPTEAL